jgi:hypothetical protein
MIGGWRGVGEIPSDPEGLMPHVVSVSFVGLLAAVANLPLGYWREGLRKFSVLWFVAVHASIPLIVAARLLLGVRWYWIPLLILLAVVGQITGGHMRSHSAE